LSVCRILFVQQTPKLDSGKLSNGPHADPSLQVGQSWLEESLLKRKQQLRYIQNYYIWKIKIFSLGLSLDFNAVNGLQCRTTVCVRQCFLASDNA